MPGRAYSLFLLYNHPAAVKFDTVCSEYKLCLSGRHCCNALFVCINRKYIRITALKRIGLSLILTENEPHFFTLAGSLKTYGGRLYIRELLFFDKSRYVKLYLIAAAILLSELSHFFTLTLSPDTLSLRLFPLPVIRLTSAGSFSVLIGSSMFSDALISFSFVSSVCLSSVSVSGSGSGSGITTRMQKYYHIITICSTGGNSRKRSRSACSFESLYHPGTLSIAPLLPLVTSSRYLAR